ncbi:MAG: hypothetical protein FWG15_01305 [Propionibacteriaceae bacterium]|nr:hypothetical protein [Propionibacteriaceae bacterium]
MATLTIRGIDETTRDRIQLQAARNRRSMESEVRAVLDDIYGQKPWGEALITASEQFRRDSDGIDLDIPPRSLPQIVDLGGGEV